MLEGDPGAGKSVALRHVASQFAKSASTKKRLDSTLPVYVNLKELRCRAGEDIDLHLIKRFVSESLRRLSDRFVDEFVDSNFDKDRREGKLMFFFDSFDEIPEVLSSTEGDETTKAYSDAIAQFMEGTNSCRAVVASRSYRGPDMHSWTTFKILDLSNKRQRELIRKSFVNMPELGSELVADLTQASDDVKSMARNPMLLGLLCEHVKAGEPFPSTVYEVYSAYVDHRFGRDQARLLERFNVESGNLSKFAEELAFCMMTNDGIGLSPAIKDLYAAYLDEGFECEKSHFDTQLSALAFMRLARMDPQVEGNASEFTFSHRRFQEYFATKVVLSGVRPIEGEQLIRDARWRETAVVLLQTGAPDDVEEIAKAIEADISAAHDATVDYTADETLTMQTYPWPRGLLHILKIVQAGWSKTLAVRLAETLPKISQILEQATSTQNRLDKKYALSVIGSVPAEARKDLMVSALADKSNWLNDVVFQQASRLDSLAGEIRSKILIHIASLYFGSLTVRDYASNKSYLQRIPNSEEFVNFLRLARLAAFVEYAALVVFMAVSILYSESGFWGNVVLALLYLLTIYLLKILSLFAMFVGANLRAMMILWVYLTLLSSDSIGLSSANTAIVLMGFLASWPLAAIANVWLGSSPRIITWPFCHMIIAYFTAKSALSNKDIIKNLSFYIIIFPVIAICIFFGLEALAKYAEHISIVLITLNLLMFAILAVGPCFMLSQDFLIIKRVARRPKTLLNPRATSRLLRLMKTSIGMLQIIKKLERSDLGDDCEAWEATILHRLGTLDQVHEIRPENLRFLGAFPTQALRMLNRGYRSKVEDGLYRLLERLRSDTSAACSTN